MYKITSALIFALLLFVSPAVAADHGDAPALAVDQGSDIGDVYAFLDPADNTKLVLAMTFHGFIVPGEAVNFGFFDSTANYRFELETTDDAKSDLGIDISFSKRTATSTPQTATIKLPGKDKFSALTTLPNLSSSPATQTVTTSTSGVKFFAGEVDDPFFFDIPAFARFAASVRAGTPDATILNRGRDSFAGYNIMAIVLSIPVANLKLKTGMTTIGVEGLTQRHVETKFRGKTISSKGAFYTVDRLGNPGLNVLVNPYGRKDQYNLSKTTDDAKGKFADDIIASLQSLGTDSDHINALAGIYITKGDFLHLNITTANTGNGGGDNSGAGFPNGRRFKDDVVDTFLTVVANGTTLGDSVSANDVPLSNTFPFLAPPQQPRDNGVLDDNTRN
jgi:hypothetical protein